MSEYRVTVVNLETGMTFEDIVTASKLEEALQYADLAPIEDRMEL